MSVFVSSTYEDLVDHRRAVIEALEQMGQLSGRMEVFGARPEPPLQASLAEVAKSDLFVGIYAHRYGFMPDGAVSITEREYDEAVRLDKPVFAFIVDDDFDWKAKFIDSETDRNRLVNFKARLRKDRTPQPFRSPEHLASRVVASVARYLLAGEANRIPTPSPEDPVSLANVALLHTSFFSPKGTKRINDGRRYYQFEVVVIAPRAVMQRIRSVTYRMQNEWPEDKRVQVSTDPASRFKMKELANGTSIVLAEIQFTDQAEPLRLNRFIDLREEGPRI